MKLFATLILLGAVAVLITGVWAISAPAMERRKLLDDAGDGSDYSRLHAVYHPLMRAAAATVGFFDFMVADPKSGRLIYTVEKEVYFTTSLHAGPYCRSNVTAVVARCAAIADRSAVCLEDFASYAPSGGAPVACMGAPVIDQGVIGVLIAQLSNEEIDNVVTGDRHWRQEGFGATGDAYLVGPDYLVRSAPRAFYKNLHPISAHALRVWSCHSCSGAKVELPRKSPERRGVMRWEPAEFPLPTLPRQRRG